MTRVVGAGFREPGVALVLVALALFLHVLRWRPYIGGGRRCGAMGT
jgi:hypothetical protein